MKKYRAATAISAVLISCLLLEATAVAGQDNAEMAAVYEKAGSGLATADAEAEETKKESGADEVEAAISGAVPEVPEAEPGASVTEPEDGILALQIPKKMGIVIDPWEMDGRGQVYSEQYVIKNSGEEGGTLTLSFQCCAGEGGSTVIRADNAGIHDDDVKAIYVELKVGESRVALSEAGAEYAVELLPGEELAVCFTGEVNENASEGWGSAEIEVEGIYSWQPWDIGEGVAKRGVEGGSEPQGSVTERDALLGNGSAEGEQVDESDVTNANGAQGGNESVGGEDLNRSVAENTNEVQDQIEATERETGGDGSGLEPEESVASDAQEDFQEEEGIGSGFYTIESKR